MTYDELLIHATNENIMVKEKPLINNDGRIYKNRIAIRKDIQTNVEKACILSEELGHYYTTTGNIINTDDIINRKQEYQARLWAYNKQIGLMGLINAFNAGCQNSYETAEYLDVTEDFLSDTLAAYKNKYGICTTVDNYTIYFIPNLNILKKL